MISTPVKTNDSGLGYGLVWLGAISDQNQTTETVWRANGILSNRYKDKTKPEQLENQINKQNHAHL